MIDEWLSEWLIGQVQCTAVWLRTVAPREACCSSFGDFIASVVSVYVLALLY